jgi:hypothetical protein
MKRRDENEGEVAFITTLPSLLDLSDFSKDKFWAAWYAPYLALSPFKGWDKNEGGKTYKNNRPTIYTDVKR